MPEFEILKTVYLLRHGQSKDNIAPVFQSSNSPLNEKGKKQAEYIAERISKISFDSLISSPILRAKQTAEVIAQKTGKNLEYSENFSEVIKPSSLKGKSYTDKKAVFLWRKWQKSLFNQGKKAEDGENYNEFILRVDKALQFLTNREEKSLVVVSHGFFIKTIIARVLLGNFLSEEILQRFCKTLGTENTGLTVLRYYEGFEEQPCWHLWIYNDNAHLG
ncbi:histidine phosphatase family protein [Candidatus Wolfebacteria bacterium]|nr:histidine phosphatase family protein [Candidatus Wolfebacteria bacterium]